MSGDEPTWKLSNHVDVDKVPGWVFDAPRLWFSKADGDTVKQKVNGLSIGLDYVKVALTGIALGLTPVKVDFTGLKLDEKGFNIAGITRWEWPWIKDETKFKRWILGKKGREKEDEKKEKENKDKEASETLKKDLGRAHRRIDKIEGQLRTQRKQVGKVAEKPNVSDQNPRRIQGVSDQVKALETRLNQLMTALG